MEIFSNIYIFIIFSIAYFAVVLSVRRMYSLTKKKIYRLLQCLFLMMIIEWIFTCVYEIAVSASGIAVPRLSSAHLLYQIPKVLIKNAENALIALCISSYLYGDDEYRNSCGRPFVIIVFFAIFEIILYFFPDSNLLLFIRGVADAVCLILVIISFAFPWNERDRAFKIYAVFSFAAFAAIVFESFAVLYIPAVNDLIPDFYESGDLYYFVISLLLFFGLSNLKEEYTKKQLKADLEKKMESDLEQRIEEYKISISEAAAAEMGFNAESVEGFCRQYKLTKREKEILKLVIAGNSNADIAEQLFISAATVRVHQHTAFQKVGVSSQTELIDKVSDYARANKNNARVKEL